MDSNIITDKRSVIEINNIIEFCNRLVLKDNDKAEAAETKESLNNGYKFLNAMLKSDTLDSYEITRSDLLLLQEENDKYHFFEAISYNPYLIDLNKIPDEYKDILLELKRFQYYTKYLKHNGEKNSYYKEIYDLYIADKEDIITKFSDFINNTELPFYAAVRLYKNFSILYAPSDILNSTEVKKFKEAFIRVQNYFLKTCYNDAYKIGNPKYQNLCALIIVFLAIEQYFNLRLENITDIDFFDEYSIRNMFLSYGLDYFFDFPLRYQKRVLKNINFLIKNKGTTKAIISVLKLFGFENIKVMKYVLTKQYPIDEEGKIDLDNPELKFYGLDSAIMDIEKALVTKNTLKEYDYDEFVSTDKYWQLNKEEKYQLLTEAYSYIYTKYISIDSFIDLAKNGIKFSNFANLLMEIETEYKKVNAGKNILNFYDYKVSQKPINVFNALLTAYVLIAKKFNVEDNIIKEPTSIAKVYGYNFGTLLDDINYFTEKYITQNYTDKEYSNYTALLLKYDLYDDNYEDIITIKNFKYNYRNGEVSQTEYDNLIKAYTDRKEARDIFKEYLIGNIEKDIAFIQIADLNLDFNTALYKYITYVFLTEDLNETYYNKLLARYSLDKNEVLSNYFVKLYLNNEINDEKLDYYLNKYNLNLNTTNINITDVKSAKYLHENNKISLSEYESLMNEYLVDNEDAVNYTIAYITGEISARHYRTLISSLGLEPDEILFDYITYKYLDDELSEEKYRNNILVYHLDEDNLQDVDGICTYKRNYKAGKISLAEYNEFRDQFKQSDETETKIKDYYNGEITENAFNYYMVSHNLDIKYSEFKYLTYNFLNVDFIEQMYDQYITMYKFDRTKADEIKEYKINYYNGKILESTYNKYKNQFNEECKYIYRIDHFLTTDTVNKYKQENLDFIEYTNNMTLSKFSKLYINNYDFKEQLEKEMMETWDYNKYRTLKAYYECCFLSNYRYRIFGKHTTYSDYLKEKDVNLYNYIEKAVEKAEFTPDEKEIVYNEYLLQICSSLETYLNDDKFNFIIQGNNILNEYIKTFVYEMVDFIKSYTVQIKDINTILTFDDKFLNRIFLFDELENFGGHSEMAIADLILHLYEDITFNHQIPLTPDIFKKFEEMIFWKNTHIINNKDDNIHIKDEVIDFFSRFTFADLLLTIRDNAILVENKLAFAEVIPKFQEKLEIETPLVIGDTDNILDEESKNNERSDKLEFLMKFIYDKSIHLSDLILTTSDKALVANNKSVAVDIFPELKEKLDFKIFIDIFGDKFKFKDEVQITNNVTISDKLNLTEKINMENSNNGVNLIDLENNLIYIDDLLNTSFIYENLNSYKFDLNRIADLYETNINNIGTIIYYVTEDEVKHYDFTYHNGLLMLSKLHGVINYIKLKNINL